MADVTCPRCGHGNPLGSNFCSSCGMPLNQHPDETTTVIYTPESPADTEREDLPIDLAELRGRPAVLVVTRGPKAGSRIELTEPLTTAGRHPESDIFLDDITVSRRHAEVRRTAAGFEVVDAGSLNGTYVNRQRIERAGLVNGDELQIGRFKLVFFSDPTGHPDDVG